MLPASPCGPSAQTPAAPSFRPRESFLPDRLTSCGEPQQVPGRGAPGSEPSRPWPLLSCARPPAGFPLPPVAAPLFARGLGALSLGGRCGSCRESGRPPVTAPHVMPGAINSRAAGAGHPPASSAAAEGAPRAGLGPAARPARPGPAHGGGGTPAGAGEPGGGARRGGVQRAAGPGLPARPGD